MQISKTGNDAFKSFVYNQTGQVTRSVSSSRNSYFYLVYIIIFKCASYKIRRMYLQISEHQSIIPNCHLCGVQSSDLTSYLDNFSEAGHFIFLAIQKYLAIDVREKSICNNCGRKVEDWDSFYLKCHELQALFKQTEDAATVISLTPIVAKHVVEEVSTDLNTNDIPNNFSNFVQELTQEKACADDTVLPQMIENPGPSSCSFEDLPEEDENKSQSEQETEDEFEEITSEEEDQSGESSDESDEPSKPRKGRHKKFVFTIPFLERKLDRKFSPSERTKLQKFIRKRQNTSICKYHFPHSFYY